MDIDFALDGGAYATLSSVVLSRGTIHAAGPYLCPNVRIRSQSGRDQLPPHGAFRGFGAPQSVFALERHIDRVAAQLGLPPEEFRRRNFIHEGQTTAIGQVIREKVDMKQLLDRALRSSGYHEKRERFARENPGQQPSRRGIGFAAFIHGAGFTGSGEEYLASVVGVEATPEGKVRILAAQHGNRPGHEHDLFADRRRRAGHRLRSNRRSLSPTPRAVPNSGPTVASRTSMIVGKLVESAAIGLKQPCSTADSSAPHTTRRRVRARPAANTSSTFGPLRVIRASTSRRRASTGTTKPTGRRLRRIRLGRLRRRSDRRHAHTYEVRVDDFVAVQEVGKVIHPVLAAGQIEGGVAQAIGFALYENVVWKEGRMANGQMTNYIMPTAADVPPIRVFFEETPYAYGPRGAKGIGELPMDGTAPAIVNAIENATGVDMRAIPVHARTLMEALEEKAGLACLKPLPRWRSRAP